VNKVAQNHSATDINCNGLMLRLVDESNPIPLASELRLCMAASSGTQHNKRAT
jgi:hypothetical protein